jgi:hypothetical protein
MNVSYERRVTVLSVDRLDARQIETRAQQQIDDLDGFRPNSAISIYHP